MGAYVACVCLLGLVALVRRNMAQALTLLVLLANWAGCTTVVYLTGDFYPVLFLMVADYASAMAVMVLRRSHWQSAVMAVYAVQIVCHSAYALSDMGPWPTYYSYWALTYLGWLQVALIGGWMTYELVRDWGFVFSGRPIEQGHEKVARETRR